MKSFRKELWFDIPARVGFVNITPQVQACLRESGIAEGVVLVNAMHITASVFINDDESGLHEDYEKWLEKLAPHEPYISLCPQSYRRRQRRCPHEKASYGQGSSSCSHKFAVRFWSLGTNLLRRI